LELVSGVPKSNTFKCNANAKEYVIAILTARLKMSDTTYQNVVHGLTKNLMALQ
jgi:hypothetical protein